MSLSTRFRGLGCGVQGFAGSGFFDGSVWPRGLRPKPWSLTILRVGLCDIAKTQQLQPKRPSFLRYAAVSAATELATESPLPPCTLPHENKLAVSVRG